MAAQTVARAIFMRRQRDGLAGGVVGSRGGRVRDLPGNLFGDDGDDQPYVDPCSCEFGLLGWQHVEAGQALEPFEGQLDLPARVRMSSVGKASAGSEVRRRMYFAASRLRGSGFLPRFLASSSRRFCSASACSGSLRRITRRKISGSSGATSVVPSWIRTCTSPSGPA